MNKTYLTLGGSVVASLAIGGYLGYILGRKKSAEEFEDRLAVEIEAAKEYYTIQRTKENKTPEDLVRELHPEEHAVTLVVPVDIPASTSKLRTEYHNIAAGYVNNAINVPPAQQPRDNIWDKTESKPPRGRDGKFVKATGKSPYVIDQMEFMENEGDPDQDRLVYYFNDSTLLGVAGEIVETERVGETALSLLIKQESEDEDDNVIYVRNEELHIDYEIMLSHERVSAVMGLDGEG